MTLRRVQISDFRCLHSVELDFDARFTLVSGPNGSGKTSLLEAIHLLGRGRSFRTRHVSHLIRSQTERFIVVGEAELPERVVTMGLEGSRQGIRARMAGETVASLAELAAILPVQIIDPEVHRLIEEGPARRRRFLDWGVFHVEPSFIAHWRQFQVALRQRNAALRMKQAPAAVQAWDGELVRLAIQVDTSRAHYVRQLAPLATAIARTLLDRDLSLSYRSGWPLDSSFESALRSSWVRDLETGSTSMGPQRAELVFRLDGESVRDRISRGQQKLLAASLLLAQIRLLPAHSSCPTLLLDDPAAELDTERLLSLIREISGYGLQLIVTSLNSAFSAFGEPGKRYTALGGAFQAA